MDVRERAQGYWSRTRGHPIARGLLILAVLAVIGGLIWLAVSLVGRDGGGAGAGGGAGGRGGRGRAATTVGVASATQADIPITIDGLGTVTPAATITVTPQVTGMVTQVLFKEGQMVGRGQTLAVIDPRPLRNALTQAQGQLARDQAQLANARLLLERDRTLLAQDSIARQDVDTQAALVRQLEGTVTTDRGQVDQARLNLGFSRVTAPVSGRVGLRVVDVGNYIAAGSSTGLVVLTQVQPIDVEFTVPQDDVPRIQEQVGKGGILPVTAFDRTRTIRLDDGVFSTLDNQIDTTTGTVRAKARFPNGAGRLFPNQFVNVRLQLQTLRGVVTVPITAVRTASDGDFVWKLNTDHTVTRRKVTRGPATAEMTSLTAGLQVGEKVITEGGDRLTEGARVTLPGERPRFGGRNGRRGRRGQGAQGGGQAEVAAPAPQPGAQAPGPRSSAPQPPAASAPAGGGEGGGGFQPSPEMRAAREAMRQACAADLQTLCAGQQGREANACLRQNADKASPACQAAIARMPRRQRPAGG